MVLCAGLSLPWAFLGITECGTYCVLLEKLLSPSSGVVPACHQWEVVKQFWQAAVTSPVWLVLILGTWPPPPPFFLACCNAGLVTVTHSNSEKGAFGSVCFAKCPCFGYYGSVTNELQNWWLQTTMIIYYCSGFRGLEFGAASCSLVRWGLGLSVSSGTSSLCVGFLGWEDVNSGAACSMASSRRIPKRTRPLWHLEVTLRLVKGQLNSTFSWGACQSVCSHVLKTLHQRLLVNN